ncbi:glycerophosphodiester phosphodiesterase [Pelistega sp. MC2]|uniref:glycerophosphodiester phosphodiesterase n=1 Tax=Pelistega sp. MC2 TaxID=1720297 RepID=UPI0008D9D3FF|nr:glycerophosphodiester phosphodiesterase [Pelistega sp. MC2]
MSTTWAYPRLIAHRGGGHFAPENTLAAMRCGLNYGFDMVEFDAKLSKDNVLILLHDDDIKRTSNGKGLAAKKTYAELLEFDMGQWHSAFYTGEPIPKLESIIRFTQENNIICNVEIKPCPGREKITGKLAAEAVSSWFKNAEILPLLSSFSAEALEAAYKAAPELPRAYLCEQYDDNAKQILKKLDCVAVNPRESTLTEKIIKTIHKDGYRICAWTVNDYQRAKQLLAWGCDAIFTDELERVPASMA